MTVEGFSKRYTGYPIDPAVPSRVLISAGADFESPLVGKLVPSGRVHADGVDASLSQRLGRSLTASARLLLLGRQRSTTSRRSGFRPTTTSGTRRALAVVAPLEGVDGVRAVALRRRAGRIRRTTSRPRSRPTRAATTARRRTPCGYPAYHRLDLRAERVLAFRRSALTAFVEVDNVYDRDNIYCTNGRGALKQAAADPAVGHHPRCRHPHRLLTDGLRLVEPFPHACRIRTHERIPSSCRLPRRSQSGPAAGGTNVMKKLSITEAEAGQVVARPVATSSGMVMVQPGGGADGRDHRPARRPRHRHRLGGRRRPTTRSRSTSCWPTSTAGFAGHEDDSVDDGAQGRRRRAAFRRERRTPVIDRSTLRARVEGTTNISTIPDVVVKLRRMMDSPQMSAATVGDEISKDQVLAAKVLRLVNSGFYGFRTPITTITQAMVLLGFDVVKTLVLSASVLDILELMQKHVAGPLGALAGHRAGGQRARRTAEACRTPRRSRCRGCCTTSGKIIIAQRFPAEHRRDPRDRRDAPLPADRGRARGAGRHALRDRHVAAEAVGAARPSW